MILERHAEGAVGVDVALLHHLAHVDVLDRVVIGVEAEIAAHGGEIGRFQRLAEGFPLVHIGLLHRAQQKIGRIIALAGVKRGEAAVFGLEGGHEFAVGEVVEILVPLRGVPDAERRIAHRLQDVLIEAEGGADKGQIHARIPVLLQEGDPHAAGQEEEHAVGPAGADLGDLGGVILLSEPGIDLARDLALVEALEAGERILAGRVVGGEDEGFREARVIGMGAGGLVEIVILPGDVEIERVAAPAGERRGAGIGRDVEPALRRGRGHHRHREVGPDDARQHVHLVLLDHAVGELHGDVGLALIVLDHHLHIRRARKLQRQQEAIAHIDPEPRAAARKRGDHADLELLLPRAGLARAKGQRGDQRHGQPFCDSVHPLHLVAPSLAGCFMLRSPQVAPVSARFSTVFAPADCCFYPATGPKPAPGAECTIAIGAAFASSAGAAGIERNRKLAERDSGQHERTSRPS